MRTSWMRWMFAWWVAAAAMSWAPSIRAQAAVSTIPDVAGVRPGMTAQQAYDALKTHAPRAKIAIGQNTIAGITDTPVPDLMTVKIDDRVPMEIVTVWLTTPPTKQVVWAVMQSMTYPEANKLLKTTVMDALRKKFGQQTSSQLIFTYWSFDQQGGHADRVATASNCVNSQNFSIAVVDPPSQTFSYVTPLIYPSLPKSPCDALMDVKAQLTGPDNAAEFVTSITVAEVDHSLILSTKEAMNAYAANADARRQQQELEKAKQQKAPTF